MDNYQAMGPAPCPDCEGRRFFVDGATLGLASSQKCNALYCSSCGRVTFYINTNYLVQLKRQRARQEERAARAREQQQEEQQEEQQS